MRMRPTSCEWSLLNVKSLTEESLNPLLNGVGIPLNTYAIKMIINTNYSINQPPLQSRHNVF